MSEQNRYSINMDAKFGFLELINVPELIDSCKEKWSNQTLCKVNDSLVRLGIFQEGEFHWHKHDKEDEFFFVLKGKFYVELEGKTVALQKHEGITVPKGVLHRTYVKEPAAVLTVEADSINPTGD
jgi:mannose-6-phosphate isomerase-like protein (cupin superfamily)